MELGSYTAPAFGLFLGLSVILCVALLVIATVHWLRARARWAAIIEREGLAGRNDWSRVKVWSGPRNRLACPVYALAYVDDQKIRIESGHPINQQLVTIFDRTNSASHWRNDCVEFKAQPSDIRIKAIGAGTPVSSISQTDALWCALQPDTAHPFDNGVRQVESWADRRSKLALLALGIVALVVMIEILFLDAFWLLSSDPFLKIWWIPIFAAMPIAIGMMRDYVPSVEVGAATLMLAIGFALGGHIGLKRVDQWVSTPEPRLYVLRINGDRELVPANALGPAIGLSSASSVWNDIALGSQHTVMIHGGVLGTAQINYDRLLPSALPTLAH